MNVIVSLILLAAYTVISVKVSEKLSTIPLTFLSKMDSKHLHAMDLVMKFIEFGPF